VTTLRKPLKLIARHGWRGALAALSVLATFSVRARADVSGADKAAAQTLFDQAKDLLARGNAAEACPKLEESQRLDPTSGTLINLAACYEQQGKLAAAWSTFLQAAAAARAAGHLERDQVARERAAALENRLSKIVINVSPKDATGIEVQRDGVVVGKAQWGVPMPTEAGTHQITASGPGRKPWTVVVTAKGDGDTINVNVPGADHAPMPAPPPPEALARSEGLDTQRTLAIVAGGVGVAGLVTGTVFGFVSKSKRDEADLHCVGSNCRDQLGVDLRGEARNAGNVSTVALLVGAAGIAGGAALWFAAPTGSSTSAPQVGLGLGTVVVAGSW
jgi:hypothetical protein